MVFVRDGLSDLPQGHVLHLCLDGLGRVGLDGRDKLERDRFPRAIWEQPAVQQKGQIGLSVLQPRQLNLSCCELPFNGIGFWRESPLLVKEAAIDSPFSASSLHAVIE